jgi:hypothetical protein
MRWVRVDDVQAARGTPVSVPMYVKWRRSPSKTSLDDALYSQQAIYVQPSL